MFINGLGFYLSKTKRFSNKFERVDHTENNDQRNKYSNTNATKHKIYCEKLPVQDIEKIYI